MTKLSQIIDTDAVYRKALRQLRGDSEMCRLTDEAITASKQALGASVTMRSPFARPAAPAPPTGPRYSDAPEPDWDKTGSKARAYWAGIPSRDSQDRKRPGRRVGTGPR